jgi:hypothetical protein
MPRGGISLAFVAGPTTWHLESPNMMTPANTRNHVVVKSHCEKSQQPPRIVPDGL